MLLSEVLSLNLFILVCLNHSRDREVVRQTPYPLGHRSPFLCIEDDMIEKHQKIMCDILSYCKSVWKMLKSLEIVKKILNINTLL